MSAARTPRTDGPAGGHTEHPTISMRELGSNTLHLAVSGEIDAATAPEVLTGIESRLRGYHQLVLDLSHVDFFSTAGYSALHRLQVYCSRAAIDWVLIAGREVRRLLRICDPDGLLPTADNIVSAVATLARGPHRTPQLRLLR
ncbi:MAG: STAS domain-containing protein [Mycobacterium sp.]|nr:STAS domain-containing protein [Mycobacterium sp.]